MLISLQYIYVLTYMYIDYKMEKKRGEVNVLLSEHVKAAFCVRVCAIYLIVYIGTDDGVASGPFAANEIIDSACGVRVSITGCGSTSVGI
jgi:hypothetical protein